MNFRVLQSTNCSHCVLYYRERGQNAMRIIDQELQIPVFSWKTRIQTEKTLYIDIETTGLNRRRSHLYLLGAMYKSGTSYVLRQWFAERPSDEENILRDFFSFCTGFSFLVQFNGSNFDLPYLCHKADYYDISTATMPADVTDLYQLYRPLKRVLSQNNMKLTSLEAVTGYPRTDHHSGKDLIKVYETWLQTADPDLLSVLCQHNTDDIAGMLWLERLDTLTALRTDSLVPERLQLTVSEQTGYLCFICQYPSVSLPTLHLQTEDTLTLDCRENTIILSVPVYEGTLYHFFRDYKNYYYFPAEDRALHKSVAIYADSSSRVRATKETCYEPYTGRFLRTFAPLNLTMFQTRAQEKNLWFITYDDSFLTNTKTQELYVRHMIQSLLSERI